MDAVACAAGVGKGTLFRRFGDRANLFHALLDDRERRLQEGFIRGAPPLGPGADPTARLIAFGHALIDFIEETGAVLLAAEAGPPGMRYGSPVYAVYRAHVRALLRERAAGASAPTPMPAGEPAGDRAAPDVDYLADALLGALEPALVCHQRQQLGMSAASSSAAGSS